MQIFNEIIRLHFANYCENYNDNINNKLIYSNISFMINLKI